MTNKIKLEKENSETVRWLNFANSFLDLALVGLLDYKKRKKVKILIPVIFCIKHGLELWLKGLLLQVNGCFDQKHNQVELFNDIENFLSNCDIKLKQKIVKLKTIVQNYHYNRIGGQMFIFENDHMNINFRYLVMGSQEYKKLASINVKQLESDINEIFLCSTSIDMHLQLSKAQKDA